MDGIVVRLIAEADFAPLAAVGAAAYAAAYHHMWPRASDLAAHLETFAEPALRAFAASPGAALWVAQSDGRIVGFLSFLASSPDPVTQEPGGAEIPRIFLLPNVTRRGIGRRLFVAAVERGRAAEARYVWLDAMDRADWAVATYLRWGLARIGSTTFPKPVAPGYAGMAVFRMDLGG